MTWYPAFSAPSVHYILGYKWDLYTKLQTIVLERQREKGKPGSHYPTSFIGQLASGDLKPLLCELKRYPPLVLSNSTPPFDKNPLRHLLPADKRILKGRNLGKCAMVTSSGCLAGSGHGPLIGQFNYPPDSYPWTTVKHCSHHRL